MGALAWPVRRPSVVVHAANDAATTGANSGSPLTCTPATSAAPVKLPGDPSWPRPGLHRIGQLVLVHHAGLPFACPLSAAATRSTVVVREV